MSTWTAVREPSTKAVQHAYVNARAHEINKGLGKDYRTQTIEAFRSDPILAARIKGYSGAKKDAFCADAYDRFTKILQSRDLTINFEAVKWFSSENNYISYTQMYERAIGADGKMLLKDDAAKGNFAEIRAAADDRITLPGQWAVPTVASKPEYRGLRPGGVSGGQIAVRMMAGGDFKGPTGNPEVGNLSKVPGADGSTVGFHSPNAQFNPRSKQVFAALNYGRRPNGSSIYYGRSFITLHPKFKTDAIYFSGDTFHIKDTSAQVSYQTLGAIFLKSSPEMRKLLVDSCFDGVRLPDTKEATELMEAHIFQPLNFAGGLLSVNLEASAPNVVDNAKKFCRKWGIPLNVEGGFSFKGKIADRKG